MASILCTPLFCSFYLLKLKINVSFLMQESVAEYITGPSNIVAVEHKMYSDDFASECYMAVSHDWAAGCTLHYTLCAIYTNTAL